MTIPDKKTYTLTIPAEWANERLDHVLAKLLPDYSRTQIKASIDAGLVQVDGHILKGKTKVKGHETVLVEIIPRKELAAEPENIPLNIVYEDESLMVINKPVGLVVHPGAGNATHTLLNALLHYAPELQMLPRAGILHRLDKDTSGLLVVAKTAPALKNLSHQLKKRELLREYQAIVYGPMISGGIVDAPIDRHPLQRKRMAIVETGKPAVTHYRVAEKFPAHTRLKLRLETGRTHQIRVHLSYIHHPIIGDPTYGGRAQLSKGMTKELIFALRNFKRQALHAYILGLTHPETGEWIQWEIALPDDIQALLKVLRDDIKDRKQ